MGNTVRSTGINAYRLVLSVEAEKVQAGVKQKKRCMRDSTDAAVMPETLPAFANVSQQL
jgi:hypothetical protein